MDRFAELDAHLSEQLLATLRAARGDHFDPMAWFHKRPNSPVAISREHRIEGLATFWAEAKVSFAFWDHVTDLDWDAAFREFLPRVSADVSPAEYYRLLRRFASLLRDGHTDVLPPPWFDLDQGAPPIRLAPVEGLPTVVEGDTLPLGAVIVSVDGRPAGELIAERVAWEPGSTDRDRLDRVTAALLSGPRGTEVTVEARLAEGRTITAGLRRDGVLPAPPLLQRIDLGAGRVLVRISSWQPPEVVDQFHAAFPHFNDVRCLIIDLRRNRGGDSRNGYAVLSRLVSRPIATTAGRIPLYGGALRAWSLPRPLLREKDDILQPDSARPRFAGPVAVLTSAFTYSASENFCAAFRGAARGLLVGEPTGGSTGQPVIFPLPAGGVGLVCARRTTFADGSPIVGRGIEPDLYVPVTLAGVAAGRDEVLEAAIAAL